MKVLAFHDNQRTPACASCTGNTPIYACPRCGREDRPYGRLCALCTLNDRATALLADPSGTIHPQLQPVFDAWMAGAAPRSTVQWFNKPSSRPEILRAMALGELPISHTTFDNLPSTRGVNYIRDLLTATGVLEPYQPLIARTTHWLNEILQLLPKHHADLIQQFAQWHLLRRLRHLETQNKVTRSAVQNARATIITAIRLLIRLDELGIDLADTTQDHLDAYLSEYPGRGSVLNRFIDWTNHTNATHSLRVPHHNDRTYRFNYPTTNAGPSSKPCCTTTRSAATPASPDCSCCCSPNRSHASAACVTTKSRSNRAAQSPPHSTPSPSKCLNPSTNSYETTSPTAAPPPSPTAESGSSQEDSQESTWPPRTSEPNSSPTESAPTMHVKPPCSTSRPTCPHPSSLSYSEWPPSPPPDGPPCQHELGANTPPCDSTTTSDRAGTPAAVCA
ncbi:hypothetical protein ABTW96_22535 [Nocardia beijingensis]|uniref:hypothetical protein n=1 Tax=Nocardia beijingensis TaxID=95162 RepID=UPI00331D3117